jgi:D-tyrosyl-tRNA(Tyr) deacylase
MRAVVQRVQWARVKVDGKVVGEIGPGLLTLIGFEKGDDAAAIAKLMQRLRDMRVFSDENGKMNLSLADVKGAHLLVSQFTLAAQWTGGRRPGFDQAESPEKAKELFQTAVKSSHEAGMPTQAGEFGADMKVELLNDGPVTFLF